MIHLPRLLVLTDRHQAEESGRTLAETVKEAVEAGARAVVLREKDLPAEEREHLAAELLELVAPQGGLLLVASDRSLAERLGAAGIHLAASDPWDPSRDLNLVTGRSCHDAEELARAAQTGTHYATLSPVFPSPSKPGYGPALGLSGLAQLLHAPRPRPRAIYGLGGVTPGRVGECLQAGAYGVAVMGAVMRATDPGQVVASLEERLPAPEVIS